MKFLESLLAGIVIGILIAPDKGSVTRKKLLNSALNHKGPGELVNDGINDIKETANEIADEFRLRMETDRKSESNDEVQIDNHTKERKSTSHLRSITHNAKMKVKDPDADIKDALDKI